MIYIFGTVCLDRIRYVQSLPKLGAYVDVESETIALGGEAANTASHLRRWNDPSSLLGNSIGLDADGRILDGLLAEHGLGYDTHAVPIQTTPVCDVYVTPDGERTMFGLGFTNLHAPVGSAFSSGEGWFSADANLRAEAEEAAKLANQGGLNLYLMDLPSTSDLLKPGVIWQSSTRWIGGRGDRSACEAFVAKAVKDNGCTVILTDSGRGFYVGQPDQPVRAYQPFPRPSTIDSTGSGDLFRAGMLHGLELGWDMPKCLTFAAAAAALGAGSLGASEGPDLNEVQAHIEAHPEIAETYR